MDTLKIQGARLVASILGASLVLAACATGATPDSEVTPADGAAAPSSSQPAETAAPADLKGPPDFSYERVRPVAVETIGAEPYKGMEMQAIEFDSPAGGTATGYLVMPTADPEPVGILWGHGLGGGVTGRTSFDPMSVFACAGATSLVVDAPYARPGSGHSQEPLSFTPRDRSEQIQLVRDMRRGLDILQDLGAERLGFGGISYGSAIGGELIGVDDRVEAALLLLGNGGVVERMTDEKGEPVSPFSEEPQKKIDTWLKAMRPIEPALYIGKSDADILFMNGKKDEYIPPAEAKRFQRAAKPGYEVYWMDAGHDIPFTDFPFHNRWLGTKLGLAPDRLDACTTELFPDDTGW